jgi:hypothetical protein
LMATISPILNLWDGIGSSRLFLGGQPLRASLIELQVIRIGASA